MLGKTVGGEIAAVRRSLSALDRALSRLAAQLETESRAAMPSRRSPRKLNLSPARRKALQLHGQYMGFIRQLKPRAKARVRAIRMSKGLKAAIAKAKKLTAVH